MNGLDWETTFHHVHHPERYRNHGWNRRKWSKKSGWKNRYPSLSYSKTEDSRWKHGRERYRSDYLRDCFREKAHWECNSAGSCHQNVRNHSPEEPSCRSGEDQHWFRDGGNHDPDSSWYDRNYDLRDNFHRLRDARSRRICGLHNVYAGRERSCGGSPITWDDRSLQSECNDPTARG